MPFTLKAKIEGHVISASARTAKEAFAKAIDWQIAKQLDDVVISDGDNDFSIAEFSEKMASGQITDNTRH